MNSQMFDPAKIKNYALFTKELTLKEFTVRYKRTSLGLLWSLISPAVVIVTLSVAFSKLMRMEDIAHYPFLVVLGMILWNYFSDSTNQSINAVHGKGSLISSINFPRSIFVISSCLVTFINLLISMAIFFLVLIAYKIRLTHSALLCSIYIVELFFLGLGFSFILIAFTVRRRDLVHLWQLVITVGFWLTPIVYTLEKVPVRARPIFSLNPMARIITETRAVIFGQGMRPLLEILITAGMVLTIFIFGYYQFCQKAPFLGE